MRKEVIGDCELYQGDARAVLEALPSDAVDCVVTSPPYWGLRDYGTASWDGGDPNCRHTTNYNFKDNKRSGERSSSPARGDDVSKCRKCGALRVDKQIGMEPTPGEHVAALVEVFREVWRVLKPTGTLWLNYGDCYATAPNGRAAADVQGDSRTFRDKPYSTVCEGLKPKDLVGMPWRVAFALQSDGWWLRQDIIWHKPNPMPESVRDRCTKAHEYIFLLSKSHNYYFDSESIKEPAKYHGLKGQDASGYKDALNYAGKHRGHVRRHAGFNERWDAMTKAEQCGGMRSKRDVWTVATKPFRGAHFATFPPDLIKPCILAGCPEGGVLLDPFGGSGTTGLVAALLGRRSILIELNPAYVDMAGRRLEPLAKSPKFDFNPNQQEGGDAPK